MPAAAPPPNNTPAGAAPQQEPLDAKAKRLLREVWPAVGGSTPGRNRVWPMTSTGKWLRGRPKNPAADPLTYPLIVRAGKGSKIEPDGLYVWWSDASDYVDLVVFETCKTRQNLEEKQGKYSASAGALALEVRESWLAASTTPNGNTSRRSAAGLTALPLAPDIKHFPVRYLTVIYVLPPDVYTWARNQPLNPQEMAMTVNSLGSYNAPAFRQWFLQAFPDGRFYTSG